MNAKRKEAAIAAFSKLTLGKTPEEMKELILADAKGYSEDEADEIIEAMRPPSSGNSKKGNSSNTLFEEWKVKPVYEDIKDGMGNNIGRKLKEFEKDAQKAIRTTSISQERADLLNTQSENTLTRLFPVK